MDADADSQSSLLKQAAESQMPASTRLNRFVILKSNLRPLPLSPAMYISLSTTNRRGFTALAITSTGGGKENQRIQMSIAGDQEGGRMRLTTGAELKQLCEIQPQPEKVALILRDEISFYSVLAGDVVAVATKLRLYREYSIKLMLAWESVCRFE